MFEYVHGSHFCVKTSYDSVRYTMTKSPIPEEKLLGIRLKELRKKLLMTQEELAEKAGLSIQHIGDIERGQANPTFSCVIKIAEVLGINVASLFIQAEDKNVEPAEMKKILINFLSTAKQKHLEMFFALYKGLL